MYSPQTTDVPRRSERRRAAFWLPFWLSCAVFAAGYVVAAWYVPFFSRHGGQPQFYQQSFDAAVLEACGRGFRHVARLDDVPSLASFLRLQQDGFDCGSLPERVATAEPELLQRASRYLLAAVSVTWRLRGVSWAALTPLFAILFGAAAVGAFWAIRAAAPAWFAAVATVLLLVSAYQLENLPHLRDYSKAPFTIGLLAISAWLVRASLRPSWFLTLAAAAGVVNGLGIGFRTDLLIVGVLPLTALVWSRPRSANPWRVRATAIALLIATTTVVSWPVLRAYAGGNNIWHVIILGRMGPFDAELQRRSPVYSLGHFYNDSYVNVAINGYAKRTLGSQSYLKLGTRAYERASLQYAREIAWTFPADTLGRVYASIEQVFDLPFAASRVPSYVTAPWAVRAYAVRGALTGWMAGHVWLLTGLAFLLVAASSLRLAVWWTVALGFLGGMPSLQFQPRHYFHTELLGFVLLGLIVRGVVALANGAGSDDPRLSPRVRLVRAAVALVGAGACAWLPIYGLEAWQQRQVRDLIERYERLPVDWGAPVDGRAVPGQITSDYAAIEVPASCDLAIVPLRVGYTASTPFVDFSESLSIAIPDRTQAEATRVFLPLYADPSDANLRGSFREVSIEGGSASCPLRYGEAQGVARLPLLLYLTLPPRWRDGPLYQTRDGRADMPTATTSPPFLAVSRRAIDHVRMLSSSDLQYRAPVLDVSRLPFSASGLADGAFTYLLQTRERRMARGSLVIARGQVTNGGITLGVQRDGKWAQTLSIDGPGWFHAVVEAPDDGVYTIVLANYLTRSLRVGVRLDTFGVVAADER